MAGYTRQSLAQILNGEIVSAPPLNAEFNQILAAFNNSTGHKHDGTAAEGPLIDRIADLDQNNLIFVDTSANQINFYVESSAASVGQISIQDGAIVPFTDNDIDLGSSSFEFKDLYIDGTANIDSLVADTADINAGTIDNTIIGATTPAAATFANLTVSTGSTINFSGATVSNGGTFTTVTISGGSITGITDLAIADGGTGASTASVARTNLGVAIGTNVQAYDAGLQSISGLTTTADQMIYTTSSDTYATTSLTSAGRALLDDASASAQRTTLGLGTLATQDANSVAITGGTISGISNISDPGTSLPYTFSTTTTDSDPGSGIVRLNNATQNAATEIYIDDEDNDGTNVSGVIALLAGGNNPSSVLGYVTIRKEFAPENFITMKITTLTSASGYTKLVGTVEASSGATPFSDTDNLYFSIDVSGDKGDPGDLSGPGSSTDNAIVRFNGTGGSTVQNSAVIIDDSNNITGVAAITATGLASLADITLTAANPEILGGDTDGITYLSGGASTALGSSIRLHGNTHASLADDFMVYGSGTLQAHYDDSASTWDFQANAVTTSGAISGAAGNFSGSSRVGASGISSSPQLAVRRTSGTTAPLLDVEAAIGSFTGTSVQASNTLGAAATFDLFRGVVDSDGDGGGPTTVFSVDGTGAITAGGADFANNEVTQATLKDYAETTVIADTGATYTIDLENGNVFNLTLTGDCTYTFSNPPASGSAGAFTLIQNQDGTGSRTVTWPASVEWAEGSAPTITSTASSTDVFTFITTDGGTTWYGFTGGQDFS
jgi:hypothetical protein